MMLLHELVAAGFNDYFSNGPQVATSERASLLVSSLTASQALIDSAIKAGMDALLAYHGYFWKGEAHPVPDRPEGMAGAQPDQ